jgi:hypothetical protein
MYWKLHALQMGEGTQNAKYLPRACVLQGFISQSPLSSVPLPLSPLVIGAPHTAQ